MSRTYATVFISLGFALACDSGPTMPGGTGYLKGPTSLLVVGSSAPSNLAPEGTVAGIVVTTDNAVVDLSKTIVDCTGQANSGETIGIWIQGDRTNVHIRGNGTGIVRNCSIGVLTGQLVPQSGLSGGSGNHIDGLVIDNSSGGPEAFDGYALVVSNGHGDFISRNNISGASQGGILVLGTSHSAAVAGGNSITDNEIEGFGDSGIVISSDGNTIRGNGSFGWFYNILVSGDNNVISDNELGLLGLSCGCVGVWLHEQADRNVVRSNTVTETQIGFLVEQGTFGNRITANTATAATTAEPHALDAFDKSGDCVDNTWLRNQFSAADPACILGGHGADVQTRPLVSTTTP